MKTITTRKTIRHGSPVEASLFRALTELAKTATVYLGLRIANESQKFCGRCNAQIPSTEQFCVKCNRQRDLDNRVQARLLPSVRTVGGMAFSNQRPESTIRSEEARKEKE